MNGAALASALVGPNPSGALARVSAAVRKALTAAASAGINTEEIAVALSGGADSLALAITALDLQARSGGSTRALIVDHGLRADSAAEARAVADLIRSLGATAEVLSAQVNRQLLERPGETGAREVRYRALAAAAGTGKVVLLGHTLDDQAETVLLALGRGAGARSLRAMPALRRCDGIWWARPLLEIRRADTVSACEQLGVRALADPTNHPDGPWRRADGYGPVRAELRHRVLPQLTAALGQDVAPALARVARLAAADEQALGQWAEQLITEAQLAPGRFDTQQLATAPTAVRLRVYSLAAQTWGGTTLYLDQCEAIDRLVCAWRGQGPLSASGLRVWREAGTNTLIFAPSDAIL